MDQVKRIVSRKINNSKYTHALYWVGTSYPIAFLWANSFGWNLYDREGNGKGQYETLLRAKMRAFEFGLGGN